MCPCSGPLGGRLGVFGTRLGTGFERQAIWGTKITRFMTRFGGVTWGSACNGGGTIRGLFLSAGGIMGCAVG